MNPVYIHLVTSHIPVVGTGIVILLLLIALLQKSNELRIISLLLVIFLALSTIVVHQTGESAEEVVEGKAGFSDGLIQAHDVAADLAFIFIEVVGVIALIALVVGSYYPRLGHWLSILTLLILIVAGVLLVRAANMGGKISHPEIQLYSRFLPMCMGKTTKTIT